MAIPPCPQRQFGVKDAQYRREPLQTLGVVFEHQ
jgi:hypothetical protein